MQAIVQDVYGGPDRLRLSEVEAPTLAADSVLVRMHASSVNMGDRLVVRENVLCGPTEHGPTLLTVPVGVPDLALG